MDFARHQNLHTPDRLLCERIRRRLVRTGNTNSQLARGRESHRSNVIVKIAKYGLYRAGAAEAPDDGPNPEASAT